MYIYTYAGRQTRSNATRKHNATIGKNTQNEAASAAESISKIIIIITTIICGYFYSVCVAYV